MNVSVWKIQVNQIRMQPGVFRAMATMATLPIFDSTIKTKFRISKQIQLRISTFQRQNSPGQLTNDGFLPQVWVKAIGDLVGSAPANLPSFSGLNHFLGWRQTYCVVSNSSWWKLQTSLKRLRGKETLNRGKWHRDLTAIGNALIPVSICWTRLHLENCCLSIAAFQQTYPFPLLARGDARACSTEILIKADILDNETTILVCTLYFYIMNPSIQPGNSTTHHPFQLAH